MNEPDSRKEASQGTSDESSNAIDESSKTRSYRREGFEPEELKNPLPLWYTIFCVALITWGVSYFFMQGTVPADAGDLRTALPLPGSLPVDGAAVYNANCVACHQSSGAGLAGAFPPLDGSEWVLTDARIPAQILLHGVQGEMVVMGNTYNGVMPVQSHLSDQELAAVLNYIRNSWSNVADEIDADWFAAEREAFADREGPFNGGAELISVLGEPDV